MGCVSGAHLDMLDPWFHRQLMQMVQDSGGRLRITSGGRTNEEQACLYNSKGPKWAAPPGRSNHQRGLAADLDGDLQWAAQNAGRYGLAFPLDHEPWHIEPIGVRDGTYQGGGGKTTDPWLDAYPPGDEETRNDPVVQARSRRGLPRQIETAMAAVAGNIRTFSGIGGEGSGGSWRGEQEAMSEEDMAGLLTRLEQRIRDDDLNETAMERIMRIQELLSRKKGGLAEATGGAPRSAEDRRAAQGTLGGIDQFMFAIKQKESGGDYEIVNSDSGAFGAYQIMPQYYDDMAREAGVDPNDKSQDAQDQIAKYHMQKYYDEYGNWFDVAVAWYGGPGAVGDDDRLHRGQGEYPTIFDYATSIVDSMGR